jgi:AraC-like DNA-binding protein
MDSVRYFRPPALPGVEALHATFVAHRYAAHLHAAWTVAAVDCGVATFDLEGVRHGAPAGSVFVIPPGAVHTGEPATAQGYRYRVVYLDPADSRGGLPEPLAARPQRVLPVVVRHRELAAALSRLHRSLALPGRALEQGETLAAVTGQLAVLVYDCEARQLRRPHAAVTRALAYIQAHWSEDFTLADLAQAAEMSSFYLIRIFRQHVGVTPSAYRRALRVRAAQSLLKAGWEPAAAAAECGFCDQSHLNRHFKLITGVTPRQYMLGGSGELAPDEVVVHRRPDSAVRTAAFG